MSPPIELSAHGRPREMIPRADNHPIVFSSTVSSRLRAEVETLFFFNPGQSVLHQSISSTIESTGIPKLMERNRRIWIDVPERSLQCLFACDRMSRISRAVGVVLYERRIFDTLSILHLAVDPAFTLRQCVSKTSLGYLIIRKVADIGRHIKGVRRIQLPYREESFLQI